MFLDHVRAMAAYNAWMNGRLIEAAGRLPAETVQQDRGAFFGSILGTFDHLMVADLTWLRRLSGHPSGAGLADALAGFPAPKRLNERLHATLTELAPVRARLDGVISAYAEGLTEAHVAIPLAYRSMSGEGHVKALRAVLSHLFNHQTHHRGQITTLLFQVGIDPGATDLIVLAPDLA